MEVVDGELERHEAFGRWIRICGVGIVSTRCAAVRSARGQVLLAFHELRFLFLLIFFTVLME